MQAGLHTVLPQSTACQNENRGFLMIFSFNLWFLRFTSALALQVPTNETVPKGCKDTINFRDQCSTGFVKSSVGIGSRTHGNTFLHFSQNFSQNFSHLFLTSIVVAWRLRVFCDARTWVSQKPRSQISDLLGLRSCIRQSEGSLFDNRNDNANNAYISRYIRIYPVVQERIFPYLGDSNGNNLWCPSQNWQADLRWGKLSFEIVLHGMHLIEAMSTKYIEVWNVWNALKHLQTCWNVETYWNIVKWHIETDWNIVKWWNDILELC